VLHRCVTLWLGAFWTPTFLSVRGCLDSMLQRSLSILSRRPATCGIVLSTVKTSAADLIVQTTVEQKTIDNIDWTRNAVFASFGAGYLGGVQYLLYCRLFPRCVSRSRSSGLWLATTSPCSLALAFAAAANPDFAGSRHLSACRIFPKSVSFASLTLRQKMLERGGQMQVFAQTCVDQFVHIPLVYFPCFYMLKASIEAKCISVDVAREALHSYLEVAPNDNMAQWAFFLPAATLNFGFSPMHLRVPVVAGVSFLWTMLLSYRRGGRSEEALPLTTELTGK
jgi:hypothetical protein